MTQIGTLQAQNLSIFGKIFLETEVLSNQEFAAWFLLNLADEGLVEMAVATDVLAAAYLSGRGFKHLDIESRGDEVDDDEESDLDGGLRGE